MDKRPLGRSGLNIAPLVFGGNVFGWTVDEKTAFDLLDAFIDAGLNAIDTADVYSTWVPGNKGGESETIIGNWLKASPSRRERILILTKVGAPLAPDRKGLSERWIMQAVEDSLRRLRTEYIDLYQSHYPDPETPYEETLGAYDELIRQGKVRAIGASNYDAAQLGAALDAAKEKNLPRYECLQPEYNLYNRTSFEGALQELCIREGIGVITYFSLAAGFLSGKYRSKEDLSKGQRGSRVAKYLDERGMRILKALDNVSRRLSAKPAEVALAWLIARDGVTAPIASATTREQMDSLVKATRLKVSAEDVELLDRASS